VRRRPAPFRGRTFHTLAHTRFSAGFGKPCASTLVAHSRTALSNEQKSRVPAAVQVCTARPAHVAHRINEVGGGVVDARAGNLDIRQCTVELIEGRPRTRAHWSKCWCSARVRACGLCAAHAAHAPCRPNSRRFGHHTSLRNSGSGVARSFESVSTSNRRRILGDAWGSQPNPQVLPPSPTMVMPSRQALRIASRSV
jgi:hypothetical protein